MVVGFKSILARQVGGAHIAETSVIALDGIINNNCILTSTSSILKYIIGTIDTISVNSGTLLAAKQLSGQIITIIQATVLLSAIIGIISNIITNSELTASTIYKNIILTGQSIINSIVEGLQEVQRNLYGIVSTITELESALIKTFNIVGQSITISSATNQYISILKNITGIINTNIVLSAIATIVHVGFVALTGLINSGSTLLSNILASKEITGLVNNTIIINSNISILKNIIGLINNTAIITSSISRIRNIIGLINTNIISNATGKLSITLLGTINNIISTNNTTFNIIKSLSGTINNIITVSNNYMVVIKNIIGYINTNIILDSIATITHIGSVVLTGIINNTSTITNTSLIALKTLLGNITNNIGITANYLNIIKTFYGNILTNTVITSNLNAIKNLIGHVEHNISLSGIINTYNLILLTGQIITSIILTTPISILKNITGIISTNSIFIVTYELARNLSGSIITTSSLLGSSTRTLLLSGIILVKTYLVTIYTEASTVYHASLTAISRFIKEFRGGSKL